MYTRFSPSRLPAKVPFAVLETTPHACFALTESLAISYCNPAWDRFARENGGGPEVLANQVLLTPFLRYLPNDLVPHFQTLFKNVRTLARPEAQDYECSSAQVFRLYRMQVYPMQAGCGFLVINALRVAHPHDRESFHPDDSKYLHKDGLIRMCANCRRSRRAENPAAWDWVPDYVEHPPTNISHGVCPFCAEYYYGLTVSMKKFSNKD